MFQKWTFGRKIALGFSVAALIIVLVAVFGYRSAHRLIENEGWVTHTYQVRHEISDLVSDIDGAETAQRGYVITGDDTFLEPYRAAGHDIERSVDAIRTLTSDNINQQHRLDALRPVLEAKLAFMRTTIETRRNQGFQASVALISGGEGKRLMDEVRRIVGEMDHEESSLLERRRTASEDSATFTKSMMVWGAASGLLFLALIGFFITSSLVAQIGAAVGHMHSSSAELQSASNQQASGAKEQTVAMSEISTTINELLATSRQIAESSQRVAHIAGQTAGSAMAGDTTVIAGSESIAAIRRQMDLIVSNMLELGKKSQHVGVVLDIVSELAEQTNILAINATIEAAGAGDAGKRFAIVADEIRKLADRVGGSTKEIRGLIDDVRSAVNTTVMTTEIGSKAVDAGAKQFNEVASSFKQIGGLVVTASEAAKEIELSTKQQATAIEQVNIAITNVAQATRETESSTSQTLQTAAQLSSLSQELVQMIRPQSS